jgi:hypothetical protein
MTGAAAPTASAQGLLDFLFGTARRPLPPPSAYAAVPAPFSFGGGSGTAPSAAPVGPSNSFCVRTCDGRYFPIPRHANTSPAQMCRAFCPASPTKIFSGGSIEHAVAPDGTRYAELPNAFVYRTKLVDGCTCNGKSPLGLAKIDESKDPTLRPGDMVATDGGFVAYRGTGANQTAQFTPVKPQIIERYAQFSR